MSDLSLVLTDDLLEALEARFDHVIFAGFQKTGTDNDLEHRKWSGNGMMCQALCVELLRAIQDWEREDEADGDA